MSASTWTDRARTREKPAKTEKEAAETDPRGWVGVDFAEYGARRASRAWLPLLVLGLVVALGVASLRIDLIRTRYALAAAMAEEKKLIAEQHALIVRKRQLVDPIGLAILARERGFRPPEAVRVIEDPMPLSRTQSPSLGASVLPPVAAGPTERAMPGSIDRAPSRVDQAAPSRSVPAR